MYRLAYNVTSLRSKRAAGKAVRAGLALGRRISESIRSDPAAADARQLKGESCTVRTFVPEGLSESSPVRSAGMAF